MGPGSDPPQRGRQWDGPLILGIGIDLLETERMRRALERSGERFG